MQDCTYGDFVQSHFKGVVLFPKQVCRLSRNANSSLIDLTEGIHFLLILPIAASDGPRARFDELNVIQPELAGVFIEAHMLQCKVVSLMNDLPGFA